MSGVMIHAWAMKNKGLKFRPAKFKVKMIKKKIKSKKKTKQVQQIFILLEIFKGYVSDAVLHFQIFFF